MIRNERIRLPVLVSTLSAFMILAHCVGCAPRVLNLSSNNSSQAVPTKIDWTDFGVVLSRVITQDKIDYERLLFKKRRLDNILQTLSRCGPSTTPDQFPTSESRLAYFINSYHVLMLRGLIELNDHGHWPREMPADFERRFAANIDGKVRTLATLRQDVLAAAGPDWRVRLVLCNGRRDNPPLPRNAFFARLLNSQLDQAVVKALKSEQVVVIDHGYKKLLLCHSLYEIREPLIHNFEQRVNTRGATILNVLCDLSQRSRREQLNSAVGYEVDLLPPDARLCAVTVQEMGKDE